jgi:predicted GTPase
MASKLDPIDLNIVKILVFGTSNVGKTSMINLLTGANGRIGDGQLNGCTFESIDYPYTINNTKYIFTDTVGLNEASGGATVEAADALLALMKLIKKAKDGFNLVIYVRKATAVIQTIDQKNYSLIIEDLLEKKVNTLCVNTCGEQFCEEDNLNQYWEDNKSEFPKYGMIFTDGVSGCCTTRSKNPKLNALYQEYSIQTKDAIWKAIEETKSKAPVAIKASFKTYLIRMWNSFCSFTSWIPFISKITSKIINENIKKHLIELGVTEKKATEAAAQFAELNVED